MSDSEYEVENGLLLHNRGKKDYVWNTGISFVFLRITKSYDYSQWKTTTTHITNGLDPSGMKIYVTPPGKETQAGAVAAEGKGNG